MKRSFTELLSVNRGHFALESGLHGDVWFDLEPVFSKPSVLQPFLDLLAARLRKYRLSAICGPLLGGALVGYSIALQLKTQFLFTERHLDSDGPSGSPTVRYELPRALRSSVSNLRVGIVDDAINAGSAVTKTYHELRSYGANPIVFGCLLTVGGTSPKHLPGEYPPIESLEHLESSLWTPDTCPRCKAGIPLVDPYATNQQ